MLNIDNNMKVSWAPNQYIKMISEGSCDTEDWSNDAESSALTSQKYITFQNIFKIENIISQYYCFYCFFD